MTSLKSKKPNGCHQVQWEDRRGYVVVDPDGTEVSKPTRFKMQAERSCADLEIKRKRVARVGPRPCMRCGHRFDSEGIQHRMCAPCRHSDQPYHPQRYA